MMADAQISNTERPRGAGMMKSSKLRCGFTLGFALPCRWTRAINIIEYW